MHVEGSSTSLLVVSLPVADKVEGGKRLERPLSPVPVVAQLEMSIRLDTVVVAGGRCFKAWEKDIPSVVGTQIPSPESSVDKKVGDEPSPIDCGEASVGISFPKMIFFVDMAVSISEAPANDGVIVKCLIDSSDDAAVSSIESGVLVCSLLVEQAPKTADPDVIRFDARLPADVRFYAIAAIAVDIAYRSEKFCLIDRVGSKGSDDRYALHFAEDACVAKALCNET